MLAVIGLFMHCGRQARNWRCVRYQDDGGGERVGPRRGRCRCDRPARPGPSGARRILGLHVGPAGRRLGRSGAMRRTGRRRLRQPAPGRTWVDVRPLVPSAPVNAGAAPKPTGGDGWASAARSQEVNALARVAAACAAPPAGPGSAPLARSRPSATGPRSPLGRWPGPSAGRMGPGTFLPVCYAVGVRSASWSSPSPARSSAWCWPSRRTASSARSGWSRRSASMIHMSVVKELGPVLAATMLAGRVGSAMAAELGTMRVTEQIDALAMLGVDPVHYLVVPRFLACVLLIPLLTVLADCMGMLGGAVICLNVYGIDSHHYWQHSRDFIGLWDVFASLIKATVFGGFIALIALPPRLPQPARQRGRRPGGDRGVRAVVRRHPGARLLPGAVAEHAPGTLDRAPGDGAVMVDASRAS